MNREVKKNRAGVVAGLAAAALLTALGLVVTAEADTGTGAHIGEPGDVCATGFTSDPAYRRLCMISGGTADAAHVWFDGYTPAERDAHCVQAWRTGDLRSLVVETRGDVIRDSFVNDEDMINRVTEVGVMECVANGHDSADLR